MGANYHSSFTTASIFHKDILNAPLSLIDRSISLFARSQMMVAGDITIHTDTTNLSIDLAWTEEMKIFFMKPADGLIMVNTLASGSITIPVGHIGYVDLTTISTATVQATHSSVVGTTNLQPANRFLLGYVSSNIDFYPGQLRIKLSS